ncbi:hypothetical protein Tco_1163874 [Tanacetum coccineum]
MRRSRWMKLFSEYGFKAKYHLGKENVVVESWSRKKSEAKNEFWIDVMHAPTIPVSVDSSKGNFGDAPADADAFPAVTIVAILASLGEAIRGIHEYLQGVPVEEDMSTLRFRMSMIEAENASLRGNIRTMEAIETVTRSQERRTHREVEQ